MLVKMNCANGESKALTLEDLSITGKTAIYTLSGANASWEATEDCIMYGSSNVTGSNTTHIYFNDGTTDHLVYYQSGASSSSTSGQIGGTDYGVFVPKGTIVKTGAKGSYTVNFYPIGPA